MEPKIFQNPGQATNQDPLGFTAGPWSVWPNKTAENPSHFMPLDNVSNPSRTFDCDLSRGALVRSDFLLTGNLHIVAADPAVEPATTTDRALRMFTCEAWLERKDGGAPIYIVQPGTSLVYVYRTMLAVANAMRKKGTPGGFATQDVDRLMPFAYRQVTGQSGNADEIFVIHLPFYYGFLGGFGLDFVPGVIPSAKNGPFSALKWKFTNVVRVGGTAQVAPGVPFPQSTNTFTFTGTIPGYSQAGVECWNTYGAESKIGDSLSSGKAGSMVPVLRMKSFSVDGDVSPEQEYTLSKFDRSQMVQGMCLFEEDVIDSTGALDDAGHVSTIPGSTFATCLRDLFVQSNGTELSRYNLVLESMRQKGTITTNRASLSVLTPGDQSPILILHSMFGEPGGMNDYRKYYAEQADLIYSFQNMTQGIAAHTRYIRAVNFGYYEVK